MIFLFAQAAVPPHEWSSWIKDLGPTGIIVAAVVYAVIHIVRAFNMLRTEEAKRTEAFLSVLNDNVRALQATVGVLQAITTQASVIVSELKDMQRDHERDRERDRERDHDEPRGPKSGVRIRARDEGSAA